MRKALRMMRCRAVRRLGLLDPAALGHTVPPIGAVSASGLGTPLVAVSEGRYNASD